MIIPVLTFDQAEHLALKIAIEHREQEPKAMTTRWWDFRLYHPVQTTYLFAAMFDSMHKRWWHSFIETREAHKATTFECQDIFESRDMTSVWLARQSADLMGIPYDFVMNFAFNRAYERQFKAPMRPNQMYGEEFERDLLAAWLEHFSRVFVLPVTPQFKHVNYRHQPLQNEFRLWMIARVEARQRPWHRLLARLVQDGYMTEQMVEATWGKELLGQTQGYLAMLRD